MPITLDGTAGITSPNDTTGNQSYTGTLTGGTGVVNLGSGQFVKDASGNVGIGTSSPTKQLTVANDASISGLTVGKGGGAVASNTANGFQALLFNTTGNNNTANGVSALQSNTTGSNNTANGVNALLINTTGSNNTASGVSALLSNTTGNFNTASGQISLYSNTTGSLNTANGVGALQSNTTGSSNTASGVSALLLNTTGTQNTASGVSALQSNTTGNDNTANGNLALYSNTTGSVNTANGVSALYFNTTGGANTANGYNALLFNTTGSGNTALNPSNSAGGYAPVFNPTTENNRFCMGSTGVTNAYIQVAWTVVSDARDKTDFAAVPHGLDFVTQLNPIAYRYKMNRTDTEGHGPLRYGFKAQEVLTLEGDTPVIVDAEDADKLRFNDQSMIAVLVKAIQELKAEFDTYKSTHP